MRTTRWKCCLVITRLLLNIFNVSDPGTRRAPWPTGRTRPWRIGYHDAVGTQHRGQTMRDRQHSSRPQACAVVDWLELGAELPLATTNVSRIAISTNNLVNFVFGRFEQAGGWTSVVLGIVSRRKQSLAALAQVGRITKTIYQRQTSVDRYRAHTTTLLLVFGAWSWQLQRRGWAQCHSGSLADVHRSQW